MAVRARAFENAIPRRGFDDKLCTERRTDQFRLLKDFKKKWTALRPRLDAIFVREPSKRPNNYPEAVAIAARGGGVLWGFGQRLYAHIAKKEPIEEGRGFFTCSGASFKKVAGDSDVLS